VSSESVVQFMPSSSREFSGGSSRALRANMLNPSPLSCWKTTRIVPEALMRRPVTTCGGHRRRGHGCDELLSEAVDAGLLGVKSGASTSLLPLIGFIPFVEPQPNPPPLPVLNGIETLV